MNQGVYTGVVAKGNGNASPAEIKNSALRGVTKTNAAGIAEFTSLVPGHYVGRTNHLHSMFPMANLSHGMSVG